MKDFLICYSNEGEIPENAFKLLGASSKRDDDTKIGFYGSGLKYAIAVMLREDIPFWVYSGLKRVKIDKISDEFMGKQIQVMTVNDERTSITLDAGIDWEPWFAIREIYSNTLDEGGDMKTVDEMKPEKGKTKIYVKPQTPALKDVFDNWSTYFSSGRVIIDKLKTGKILAKIDGHQEFTVFRKGIRTYYSRDISLFDYDLDQLEINESRVAKYSWQAKERSAMLLAGASLVNINKFIVLGPNKEYVEWQNDFWDFTTGQFSEDWLVAISDRKLVPLDQSGLYEMRASYLILPNRLIKKLKDWFGDKVKIVGQDVDKYGIVESADMTPVYKEFNKIIAAGFRFEMHNIKMAEFADTALMGLADGDQAILSTELLKPINRKRIAPVLLEEMVHCITGLPDNCREMQSYLFETIIALIENKELA